MKSRYLTIIYLELGGSLKMHLAPWQLGGVYSKEIKADLVVDVIKASCVLHNLMQLESTPAQVTTLTHEVRSRSIDGMDALRPTGNRAGLEALKLHSPMASDFSYHF